MTAKQIKEAARIRSKASYEGKFLFTPDQMQAFEDAICREQRELCSDISYNSDGSNQIINEILNAPKPTT